MNKKLLSLAVAAGLASSSSAFAAVDLDAASNPSLIASETDATGSVNLVNAGGLDANATIGFSVSAGTSRYVRYDITGATFTSNLTATALTVTDSGAGAVEQISDGGLAGTSSVIFEITPSTGNTIAQTDSANFSSNYTITSTGTNVSIVYQLFADPVGAVNNDPASLLETKSGTLVSFAPATTTSSVGASPALIDVQQQSLFFANGATGLATSVVGGFTTTDNGGVNMINGSTAAHANITSAASLVVDGDFSFTTRANATVWLDADANGGCNTIITNASAVTNTTATFAAVGSGVIAANSTAYLCVTANGVNPIAEGAYSGTFTTVGAGGHVNETTVVSLGELEKNGDTVRLNLVLTPGGAFSNFVRVNNLTNFGGIVSFTVYNDDGDSAAFNLGDIDGQAADDLDPQASTSLITVQSIFDAAQAADATFDLGATNKLRLVIDGAFADIDAQSITLSTDDTTFATF